MRHNVCPFAELWCCIGSQGRSAPVSGFAPVPALAAGALFSVRCLRFLHDPATQTSASELFTYDTCPSENHDSEIRVIS